MYVRKIIVNNFIMPGKQTFVFDDDQKLIDGEFYDVEDLKLINEMFNGKWLESTLSFEKYYPKFLKKIPDMDLQLDALIEFTDEELMKLNVIMKSSYLKLIKSKLWFYSIKCTYPYIFPIVSLKPAEFADDKTIGIGNHYDKFTKYNSSKKDLLTVTGMNAVGLLREKYFEYSKMPIEKTDILLHKQYLEVLKSTFRNDEQFIKKLGQIVFNMDDGDVLNYGDQADFFFQNKAFEEFIDSIPLMRNEPKIREDFCEMLYECYFRDIQWIYTIKSSNDALEIKQLVFDSYCENAIYTKEFMNLFNFKLHHDSDKEALLFKKLVINDDDLLDQDKEPFNIFDKKNKKFVYQEIVVDEPKEVKKNQNAIKQEKIRIKKDKENRKKERKKVKQENKIREKKKKLDIKRNIQNKKKDLKRQLKRLSKKR